MRSRCGLTVVLCGSLVLGVVAGILALGPLLIHGFAPACSDGYAEANGTPPCRPHWGDAAPYLVVLGIAFAGALACGGVLRRKRAERREATTMRTS